MDTIHSIIAVCATLAGLWTSAVLHDVKSTEPERVIVAAASKARLRSIHLLVVKMARAAAAPSFAKPIR